MTCPACTAAQAGPHFEFRAGCKGCEARSLSRALVYVEARRCNRQTADYRAALERVGVTHAQVVEAARTDRVRG